MVVVNLRDEGSRHRRRCSVLSLFSHVIRSGSHLAHLSELSCQDAHHRAASSGACTEHGQRTRYTNKLGGCAAVVLSVALYTEEGDARP